MITVADAELLEREEALDTLRALLADVQAGCGGVAVVEGPAGQGKTALLRALRTEAGGAGVRILTAVGADLESDFPFGIVRQLFLPALRGAADVFFDGAAALAREALEGAYSPTVTTDVCHARLHGLFWLAANLAEEQPLLIVVDDAHWADEGSLKALGMLARRLEDLPIGLVVGTRPAGRDALDALVQAPNAVLIHPESLSADAVAQLLDSAVAGEIQPEFAAAAAETTGGNPLLVRELRRSLDGFTGAAAEADAVRRAVPGTITRMVQARLRRLSADEVALARAVAVLHERSTVTYANSLAGLDGERAATAHAALAEAGLLEPSALRFTHPMMREATLAGVVAGERSRLHRCAAGLLQAGGASEDEIAAQLVAAEPGAGPWAVAVLTGAGQRALAAGDSAVAQRYLQRALAESPEPVPALLLALGLSQARLGVPGADIQLAAAAAGTDPVVAARAEQARARVLVVSGRGRGAPAALRSGLEHAREHPEIAAEIEDDLLDGLQYDPELAQERRERLEAAEPRPAVLAHRAFDRAATGAPADEVRDLARRALAGGALLARGGVERPAVLYAIEALLAVEAADDARAAIDAAADAARRTGSIVGAAGVALARTRWEHEFGHLDVAQDAARSALEHQMAFSSRPPTTSVRSGLAAALLDAGDLDAAERELAATAGSPVPTCGFNALRGRILLARGRPEEAVAELEHQLALEAARGWTVTFREPTRATLVSALAEAGRLDDALALAEAELARARARGLAGAEARLLLARARLAISRDEELALLAAAAGAARRSPSALILAETLGALGSALRRAGRRTDAREPLREARELALRVGAAALEARVHQELVIAGARPQRVALAGVEGLTPSERRVAELAAAGRRNREIAEELFVTLKTVEVHLGRAYGKLGINSRSQLDAVIP